MHYEMSIRSGGQGLRESILEYFLSATIAPIWILCVSRLEMLSCLGRSGRDANLPTRECGAPITRSTSVDIAEAAAIRADEAHEALSVRIHRFADTISADAIFCTHRASDPTSTTVGKLNNTFAVIYFTSTLGIGFAIQKTDSAINIDAFECCNAALSGGD